MWRYDPTSKESTGVIAGSRPGPEVSSDTTELPLDIRAALESLVQRILSGDELVAPYFTSSQPLIAARAPGRLDVMGGIADYSGSTVLQLPLKESTVMFCQYHHTPEFRLVSQAIDGDADAQVFCMPMSDFFDGKSGLACSEVHMHHYFNSLGDESRWAAYVAGVITVLMVHTDCDISTKRGLQLHVSSTVPPGKGVSSSAALEVATMRALCCLLELTLSAHEQALLCQRVENHIVGAPCGLMDQMASSCGQQGALMRMLCQPDIVEEPVLLPDGLSLWGIDSGIRHAVTGADYSSVRIAAFMGYRYLLELAGIAGKEIAAADIVDTLWQGYLANVSMFEFVQSLEAQLPEQLSGLDFLQHFDDTTDAITVVDPDAIYAVRVCTAHPIEEHFRARLFIQLANAAHSNIDQESLAKLMGECMYQSHASYSRCKLNSDGTDDLVARLKSCDHDSGIYGARITGGGSGGVVAVLARSDSHSLIHSIASQYAASWGVGGHVFSGSSAGAEGYHLVPATIV